MGFLSTHDWAFLTCLMLLGGAIATSEPGRDMRVAPHLRAAIASGIGQLPIGS